MTRTSCKACLYSFSKKVEDTTLVECRRHAPTQMPWPYVPPDGWCGEYESGQEDKKHGFQRRVETRRCMQSLRRSIVRMEAMSETTEDKSYIEGLRFALAVMEGQIMEGRI